MIRWFFIEFSLRRTVAPISNDTNRVIWDSVSPRSTANFGTNQSSLNSARPKLLGHQVSSDLNDSLIFYRISFAYDRDVDVDPDIRVGFRHSHDNGIRLERWMKVDLALPHSQADEWTTWLTRSLKSPPDGQPPIKFQWKSSELVIVTQNLIQPQFNW